MMKRVLMTWISLLVCGAALAALDDGLVAYYPFNGNANDESGNGYDGTVVGATLRADRLGSDASAYQFDGNIDRIDLPDVTLNFDGTDTFSQSLWIKTGDNNTGNIIIAKMLSTISYRGLALTLRDGLLNIYLVNNGTTQNRIRVQGTTVLSDDQWHHVAITYNGSSAASGVKFYIDGNMENTDILADTLSGTILNSAIPTIGSRNTENYYSGAIDDVRIYNRALSPSEILQLYAEETPFAGFQPTTTHVDFGEEDKSDHLFFSGSFVLDEQSDGIDPTTDEIVIEAGPLKMEIPAGSLQTYGNVYKWDGNIGDASVKVMLNPLRENTYLFSIQAHGVDLTGWTNPAEWSLQIGNDVGTETKWLKGHLQDEGK